MKQPTKKHKIVKSNKINNCKITHNKKYGTSKLERDFAYKFLEPLGINYIYEYFVDDIGRYYDFAIVSDSKNNLEFEEKDGLKSVKQGSYPFTPMYIIEVDGDFYHSNPLFVKEDKMNPMQKHNKFVDKLKDEWCGMHCIPLLRIWENDIRNNPKKVIDMICEYSLAAKKRQMIKENKRKPH